ncbi:MAG: TIGR03617 family F420-dependent LLM class oxidoreductase [Chloroflexi bacterium]|nr:TIGR03617 family F420-dependent LLM class oxidoreductase [Chloroflexota bacterium]
MRFDATLIPPSLRRAGEIARAAEELGFAGVWTVDTAHNPFLPLALAAAETHRIQLGTAIAVAFPRSPMVMAQIAWDLAEQSQGRFILGLGTQVRAHIVRRFSSEWGPPVAKLRDYLAALRSIWQAWQEGGRLNHIGEFYRHTLMTTFFMPKPMPFAEIPIYIAGVNQGLAALAGEVCQGFHVHPFHTIPYLDQVVIPSIAEGAAKAGRNPAEVSLCCGCFVITGSSRAEIEINRERVREQIAFYASTPSYAVVLRIHGREDLAKRLSQMVREGRWQELPRQISDDFLAEVAVEAPPDELAGRLRERCAGRLQRVGYYFPYDPAESTKEALWRAAVEEFAHD